ncbi:reverse transcriptase (RNA-dependent DNA polymerase) [Frondihabitans sp. PhB188]|uniref:reverse transcriptase family protein n=1 Tax=Frondihabitans sp. PhB188 TaxID=2485200 RepID=UPI000F47EA06|nr:reverse transcriptase family protein [Frondihabitans sp. PhB188]ROQ39691.1 reverse transcriptase (RNA-dependent DNA polymerase) [Frondihabitans sp. PhB188]
MTPREAKRASRTLPPAPADESSGGRLHARGGQPSGASPYEVAVVLADAFAAAPGWDVRSLSAAGTAAFGSGRRFVPLAVLGVLQALPRPILDSPRTTARLIVALPGFVEAVRRSAERAPVVVLSREVVPVAAVGPGPRVDTVADLARLLGVTVGRLEWFADTKGWNRRAPAGPLHHYRYEWVSRPGRTPRLLEVPLGLLKTVQRTVLDELLAPMPLHDAAHGFVPGRSAVTGAALHTGREVVLALDLVSFFAAVSARQVYGLFRRAGLAEPVAHLLAGVCTHAVPVHVLSAMPDGGSSTERFELRRALAAPHLPQGAPSSPALANLSLAGLDRRLDGWARAAEAVYTRYADDLSFSGDGELGGRVPAFLRGVERIVTDEGHTVNARKTRVRRAGVRQTVTGIVVNQTTSPGRTEHDRLKAIVHNCVRYGPASQNRDGHPAFREHLLGRIAWVEQLHPARGARLRAEFDLIRWD